MKKKKMLYKTITAMKVYSAVGLLLLLPALLFAQEKKTVSLNGEWAFALDPLKVGENGQWFSPAFDARQFDKVTVPHCFSADPRYALYTGCAWYFKRFMAEDLPAAHHAFIRFQAVFYKTKIWLNGQLVGTHEGGYTPFELDVTPQLQHDNTLVVQADNSWDTTTIPGAKTAVQYSAPNNNQVYPWINYGGITRPVELVARPEVFIRQVQVMAEPDLEKGTAVVQLRAVIKNLSGQARAQTAKALIYRDGKPLSAGFQPVSVTVNAGAEATLLFKAKLPAKEVKLWNQDEPNLYTAEVTTGSDAVQTEFGIRKLEISGTKLLLNGESVKMGGCNRPLDYPGFGSVDPDQVLEQDLTLMKNGTMELSRISHYPVSEKLLQWADRHGLLIIGEAGNWQMTPKQMSDTLMREKFRSQMREMIGYYFNHPSVIAYSVGNEFQSQTVEGKTWVKDMRSFVKTLDTTRLITFASMLLGRDFIRQPEDEASQYVDFISANIYGNHLKVLQHIHEVYPGKPVYVSEFGIRVQNAKTEENRIAHLHNAMQDFRKCDFLIGASVWTLNDYRSRFPGTAANGYRDWGLVSPERQIRGMYTAWQEEFAPALLEVQAVTGNQVKVKITARNDFPSYTLRGYRLQYGQQSFPIRTLRPGESEEHTLSLSAAGNTALELVKPGGFTILKKNIPERKQ